MKGWIPDPPDLGPFTFSRRDDTKVDGRTLWEWWQYNQATGELPPHEGLAETIRATRFYLLAIEYVDGGETTREAIAKRLSFTPTPKEWADAERAHGT